MESLAIGKGPNISISEASIEAVGFKTSTNVDSARTLVSATSLASDSATSAEPVLQTLDDGSANFLPNTPVECALPVLPLRARSSRVIKMPHKYDDYQMKLPKAKTTPHTVAQVLSYHNIFSKYQSFLVNVDLVAEPKSYKQVVLHECWKKAMAEISALENNLTWDLVPLPPGKKTIGCKWVFKTKLKSDGTLDRYKARMREAAQTGSIDALYQLIKDDSCILERIDSIPFLDTPLHVAACSGRVDFMMEMMNLKSSFATRLNQDGSTPMHLALRNNRIEAVLRLLKFDRGLVRVKGREGLTPLHHVVQTGDVDLMVKFLEACPEAIEDVTVRDETVFHLAAKNDRFDAFEVLVGFKVRGFALLAMDERMREAAQTGSIDALYQLIKEDPCVLERIDSIPFLDTPLHVAACAGRVDFMMEMMNLKPSFATRLNQDGSSPLHLALRNNRIQAVLRLLKFDRGLVRVKGREGLTPLHHVVQTGDVDLMVKFLEACPEAIEDVTVRDETLSVPSEAPTPGQQVPDWMDMDSSLFYDNLESVIVSTMFWLYNTLTFWAAIWLTAWLLPSRSICLFLHITLSLFGNCYVLLVCVFTRTKAHHSVAAFPPTVAHGLSILNYSFSTILSLLVLFRIARYIRYRFVLNNKIFILVQIIPIFFFAVILVPAVLFSETIMNFFEREPYYVWEGHVDIQSFFEFCFSVKLTGALKPLWLISVAAALWSIWLSRNDKVFNNKLPIASNLLIFTKLRALLWIKTFKKVVVANEGWWWLDPNRCLFGVDREVQVRSPILNLNVHFRICGVAVNNRPACGGVLFGKNGEIRALFSGPACGKNRFSAGLFAVKMAVEIFISSGWAREVPTMMLSTVVGMVMGLAPK
ncbi:hypothetical protein GQ457_14G023370 [Hibiscus cannabinus]